MKIFIAGARSIKQLDTPVISKLNNIFSQGYDILVGDCYGADTAVQELCVSKKYPRVTVYASNGHPRNNKGFWNVVNVPVPVKTKGFDFYKAKDTAMCNDADYGYMIWDSKSRGTLNNIINLLLMEKQVVVYLTNYKKTILLKDIDDIDKILNEQNRSLYFSLLKNYAVQSSF